MAVPTPIHSTRRRLAPAGCALGLLRQLRQFWVMSAGLLLVLGLGLYAGFSVRAQWSNALFYAGAAQVLIAGITLMGVRDEISAAAAVRYVVKASVTETNIALADEALRKQAFALRVFLGSLLTFGLAELVARCPCGLPMP